jgi:hypothetical protein
MMLCSKAKFSARQRFSNIASKRLAWRVGLGRMSDKFALSREPMPQPTEISCHSLIEKALQRFGSGKQGRSQS